MIRYLNRLFLIILSLSLAFYVLYLNRVPVTVYLSRSSSYQADLGVFLIVSFFVGIFVASLITLYFATRAYFRENKLLKRERDRLEFIKTFVRAREYVAMGDNESALREWKLVQRKDPTGLLAQVEIARTLENLGRSNEALEVLSEARVKDSKNAEVLIVGAQLAKRSGNRTAALDNLELLVKMRRSPDLIREARDLARGLGVFTKALNFQELLEEVGEQDEQSSNIIRAEIAYDDLCSKHATSSPEFLTALQELCAQRPYSERALSLLAELESKSERLEPAAEALINRAKLLQNAESWMRIAHFWLKHKAPERSQAALRSGLKQLKGEELNNLRLKGLKILLELNLLTDAEKMLGELNAHDSSLAFNQRNEKLALEGLLALRLRESSRAEKVLGMIQ